MKLLNAQQLKAADLHTMTNEPIASIDLMERAAMACCTWLEENLPLVKNITVFCGSGNNGGDGLAIACPEGNIYFNTTGNQGLATAGSSDVLTGLLGSFLAQGFTPLQSAQLGAFIHGKAGDEVEKQTTARVLTAAMLPSTFAKVFKWL